MAFRDQMLVCEGCGKTFFFTVTEQRRLAKQLGTDEVEPPAKCPECRGKPRIERETVRPVEEKRPVVQSEPRPIVEDEFPLEEEGIQVKLIGTVKWFSREKGYGFITKADGADLFFHRADISKKERVWPQEGQEVEFQIRQTDKGPEAFNVSILPED